MYTAEHFLFTYFLLSVLSVHVSFTSTVLLPYAKLIQMQTLANCSPGDICGPLNFIIWTADFDKIIVIASHRIGVSHTFFQCLNCHLS